MAYEPSSNFWLSSVIFKDVGASVSRSFKMVGVTRTAVTETLESTSTFHNHSHDTPFSKKEKAEEEAKH